MKKIGTSSIWEVKYKPELIADLILPEELKQKLQSMVDKKDFPNIGLFSSVPGCILPGTRITAEAAVKLANKNDIIKKYDLTNKEFNTLKKYCDVDKYHNIDMNTITQNKIIVVKNIKSGETTFNNDKYYTNKHLKLDYWLSKYGDYSLAKEKVIVLRKYKHFFENIENINSKYNYKFNENNLVDTILRIQFKLIYTDFKNIKEVYPYIDSNLSMEFWKFRGYSEEESRNKISELQTLNILKRMNKYTEEELKSQRGYGQSIKKFTDQGYTEEESKELLCKRQSTFSLEKCISKHGKDEGTRIFNKRQEKWQNTLNSKSQEEKDDNNRRKSISLDDMIRKWGENDGKLRYNNWLSSTNPGLYNKVDNNIPGKLYYIHFYNSEIEFWKIGITKLNVENGRFPKKDIFLNKYDLTYDIIFINEYSTYLECFEKEQFILQTFIKNRLTIDHNGFKTTEAFDSDILKEFYETI